ncbi:MAG: fibronectin type III domain-containing protein [Acidimicrobiales bacterium]|nr:fibronectin type III domain-containing protein [Acidimicrobiales bacterium]
MRVRLLVVVVMGLLASACSSSDDAVTEPTPSGEAPSETAADVGDGEVVTLPPHNLTLVSTDGTAFAGSRPVLGFRNTETGEVGLVPVDGSGEATLLETSLPPGTYEIASSGRQISAVASYEVVGITPNVVVIDEPTDVAPSPVTVEFSLDVQTSPFDFALDAVTTDSVDLSWEPLGAADIASYELVFAPGATPAASGAPVALADATATEASVGGLEPGTQYTFTLYAFDGSGGVLEFRSITATTAPADGSEPAYALAPNTIVATDLDQLQPEVVSPGRVRVSLGADTTSRSSTTEIPGVPLAEVTDGCVVGAPFLASTEVAGTEAFYGLVESCEGAPPAWRSAQGDAGTTAVIDTDVPLAAVVPYLHIKSAGVTRCIDDTGVSRGPSDPLCAVSADADGDGTSDSAERALGLDPDDASDSLSTWTERNVAATTAPADLAEVEAPADLGSGEVQVTLLWTSGDDLDLSVTDAAGVEVSRSNLQGASGGQLDRDDLGDSSCTSTEARAENVFWGESAPAGQYTVHVENYLSGREACTTPTQARIQVRVDGTLIRDEVIEVGTTPDITFDVADTAAAGPTNDLEVTVAWWGPDDVSVAIATVDADGEFAGGYGSVVVNTSPFEVDDDPGPYEVNIGGPHDGKWVVTRFNGDPTCGSNTWHTESIVFGPGQGVPSRYQVSAGNSEMVVYDEDEGYQDIPRCNDVVTAHLQVRARGELVVNEIVDICDCGNSEFFSVSEHTSKFFNFELSEPPQGWRSTAAALAAPEVTCEKQAAVIPVNQFDLAFGFDEFHDVDIELKGAEMGWDIEAGLTVFVDPNIKMEAGVECSLDIDGVTFQLMNVPVPVNLELAPVLKGSLTGNFNLDGPKLELTFGFRSNGAVDARLERCGWFEIPCGVDVNTRVSAEPIGDFTVGEATMQVEGELAIGVGVEASLGVGVKNTFVTAKTGFAVTFQPLVGKLKASAGVAVNQQAESGDEDAAESVEESADGTVPFSYEDPRIKWRDPAKGVYENNVAGYSFAEETLQCPDWFVEADRPATKFGYYFVESIRDIWVCADAYCLDSLNYISTVFNSCSRAKCLVNDEEIVSSPHTKWSEGGDICPIPAPVVALAPSGNPFSVCAAASIGGELSVDFRAETFVLAWGKDKRYPVFKGEYNYPGASFELGDC